MCFHYPHGIIVGGASGLGLIVKQITGIPLSLVVYVINIIMFIAGYFFLGKSFAAKTLLSTIIFPTFLTIFENTPGLHILQMIYSYPLFMQEFL